MNGRAARVLAVMAAWDARPVRYASPCLPPALRWAHLIFQRGTFSDKSFFSFSFGGGRKF